MKYYIKRKIWQIKNLIKWIPKIWNQFDFDYAYSLDVFKFQLEKQATFLESDRACTMSAKHNASRIRMVLRLMDRVYDDKYAYEYFDKIKSLYGENAFKHKFIPEDETNKYYSMEYEYETWDNADEIEIKYKELYRESKAKQERAHKLLWKLVEHNIQQWWD